MVSIREHPSNEPLGVRVAPALEIELDLAGWATAQGFSGTHDWMDGIGPYFAVELVIDDELLVLLHFEYAPTPGKVSVWIRDADQDRTDQAIALLCDLGISGNALSTQTGRVHSI